MKNPKNGAAIRIKPHRIKPYDPMAVGSLGLIRDKIFGKNVACTPTRGGSATQQSV